MRLSRVDSRLLRSSRIGVKSQCAAAVLAVLAFGAATGASADSGYFLSGAQKSELIRRGQMHDEQQRLYDVWIVPGYVVPGQTARKGWRKAGEALQDYSKPAFFPDLHRYADQTWRFGTRDTLRDYTVKGTRNAWSSDMKVAAERTRKRVFGWWLAYPWGVLEASVESLLRIGTGIPAGVLIAGSAYTVVPAVYVATPPVLALAHAAGEGTTLPLAAAGWNTVIAPPLALFGQRPAPERADGFWMKQVNDPRLADMISRLSAWRDGLTTAQATTERDADSQRLAQEKDARIRPLSEQIQAIEQEYAERERQLRADWMKAVLERAGTQRNAMLAQLQAADISPELLAGQREAVTAALAQQGWSREDAAMLVQILLGNDAGTMMPQRDADDKADPVKRTLQILGHP